MKGHTVGILLNDFTEAHSMAKRLDCDSTRLEQAGSRRGTLFGGGS